MTAVARSAVLSASNPVLNTWIADSYGFLCEPDSLSFSIYEIATEDHDLEPVLVYGPHSVNLTADKVSTGRYAAAWTVPADEPLGRHRIEWTATITSLDQDGNSATRTMTWSRDFDVLVSVVSQPGYVLVSDMRAEGVLSSKVSDAWLIKRIEEASAQIDRLTGRWFEPRYCEWRVDGTWKPVLHLEHPIVAIESATVFGEGLIDPDSYKVYNRHLTGLREPDDRNAPKLEFYITQPGLQGPVQPLAYPYPISTAWLTPKTWAKGTQNVTVKGLFGYTDPDGSPEGDTPSEIKRAVRLLVLRNLPKQARSQERFDALNQHRLTGERTREQSYTLAQGRAGTGAYTSDTEIDNIIEAYTRPPQFAVV